jgi:hypothetical protein
MIPGTITKTEEAGVTADSVSKRTPVSFMLRVKALGCATAGSGLAVKGRPLARAEPSS